MKKLFLVLFTVLTSFVLISCDNTDDEEIVGLDVAVNFGGNMFISYNQDNPYTGLDGVTYTKGDLLPVWRQIGENLGIDFNDVGYELGKANTNTQFDDAKVDGFAGIDIINSTGANITAERANFVNLKPFIDEGKMPNLKAFLDSQPTYMPYLTAEDGGMYYTPYLDGNEEVELGFLMRIDWTEKILDTDTTGDTTVAKGLENTEIFNPATLDTKVTVATEGAKTKEVTIKYSQNIIDRLKALPNPTGDDYLQEFRAYMEETRGTSYTKLSDIFVGYDASYLTDELIALMAVVKSNPQMLRGKDNVTVFFPREARGSRVRNFFRATEMFGVRGAVSKNNWLYLDEDGDLHDARHEQSTVDAIQRLNNMYKDELILQNFDNSGTNTNHRDTLLKQADGFLIYDYNATQTDQGLIDEAVKHQKDYRLEMILPPVLDWKGDGEYFHFTESVRMLKNEAWGITKQAAKDPKKLEKAIELFDYLYDPVEGADLHLFGPEEWRDPSKTLDYQGEKIPTFSQDALDEMVEFKESMINYLRKYVGATQPIGHVRSLGLELQTVSDQGMNGYNRIRNAFDAGTYRLLGLYDDNDTWYYPVPNVFPLKTAQENEIRETKSAFDTYWGDDNLYLRVKEGITDENAYWALFKHNNEDWYADYIKYHQDALPK